MPRSATPTPPRAKAPDPLAPAPFAPSRGRIAAGLAVVLALVGLTYSNHFHNTFHFDDNYAVQLNPYIRDLHNTFAFFKDARTNDALAANQNYRPLLSVSFAVDYWLGHGLNPLWFHISTFVWYLVQLSLMFFLFRKLYDQARPDPRNAWVALFATALFGLHPAMAETVNYVMQRADLYSTLAVIAGLAAYIFAPRLRRYGVYLLPVILGLFAKQPTAVFPAILFAWVWFYEQGNLRKAFVQCLPAFAVIGALALFVMRMNSPTFVGGAASAYNYRISQPAVVLSYFRRFFLPIDLSADTDRRTYTSLGDGHVLLGIAFVLAVTAVIFWCRRRKAARPVGFGLAWFLIACVPTSWIPLAEVENDHRLFFPFVGLAFGLSWAAALWLNNRRIPKPLVAGACALILASAAWGAHERNKVWHTDESLWFDVTKKSPTNGRGLMNYGLSQTALGRYDVALDYFKRALVYNPYYSVLEINLGIVYGAKNEPALAEPHFLRAIQLAPDTPEPRMFYGRWLNQVGRLPEATAALKIAVKLKPDYAEAHYLLMQIYAKQGDRESLRAQANALLAIFPKDTVAAGWLAKLAHPAKALLPAPKEVRYDPTTPEEYLNRSLTLYQQGKYADSIAAAREALKLRPDYSLAWNNIMASCNQMGDWDLAIAAGEKAVSLDPTNQRAQNNLAWARAQKKKSEGAAK